MLFTWKPWFAKRKSTVDRPGRFRRRPSPTPRLETLEDRCCPSGIDFVQNIGTASQTGAISSLTIPVPTAVTAGDSVIVEYASTDAHGAATVTDSGGNTYTIAAGSGTEGSNGELIYIASGVHAIAAGGTITISFSSTAATDSTVASAAEFSGLSDTNPVDSSGETMNYTPPGNTTPSASVTTNQANDLLIGSISPYNATGVTPPTFTPGSGYTALAGTNAVNPANTAVALDLEYQIVSATGTYSANGTFNSTSTSDVAVAAFQAGLTAVTNVTPTSGPATGGTSVTITGTDFSGATAVNFGTTPASSFTVNSATSITAVSPAGTGTVDVTVTTPVGTSATSAADQFTYTEVLPAVTNLTPTSGPAAGGTSVTITGSNFTGATAVNFGTTPVASFTVNSPTSITAISPAGTGTVNVTVITPSGTSVTSAADQFTYTQGSGLTTGGGSSPTATNVSNCYLLVFAFLRDSLAESWLNAGASPASVAQGVEVSSGFLSDVAKELTQHWSSSLCEWAVWEGLMGDGASVEQAATYVLVYLYLL